MKLNTFCISRKANSDGQAAEEREWKEEKNEEN